MSAPTIGLALIARNEAKRLPQLLASIEGAFDEVVLVDTGSKDRTVPVFLDWCADERERQGGNFRHEVGHFHWCHDFAAARNVAESMLGSDWHSWADCDDTLKGAEHLRELAAKAPPELAAFVFDYAYGHDQHGNVNCRLKRERLVRAGTGTWVGHIHEAQVLSGQAVFVGADVCEWVHHPDIEGRDLNRNLKILRRWIKKEPENPRVLAYLGTESLARGKVKQAATFYRRYLKLKTGWDEERAQVHRKLAQALGAMGDLDGAERSAYEALRLMPRWPDSYLSLAEVAYQRKEWRNAGDWASRVLELGEPQTLLIINPLEYTLAPRILLTGALGAAGQLSEALKVADEVLAIEPDHGEVLRTAEGWRGQLKREQAAQRAVSDAQVLVAHDEQLKALELLEHCVLYFAIDHPDVVAIRSQLRERLAFLGAPEAYAMHYGEHGSQPEDFLSDERALEVAAQLPRCQFLLAGLKGQMA